MVPAPVVDGRRFDWFARFDEQSRAYAVAPDATEFPTRGRLWEPGMVLDQGAEGACCGFAAAAEAAALPVRVPRVTNAYARGWYLGAKRRDQWPGESYDGTSVLGTMKEGHARRIYGAYGWHFSVEQLAHGIVRDAKDDGGPCVAGVEWRRGSYETDQLGILRPSGEVVGGHALCLLGFVPASHPLDNPRNALRRQLEQLGLLDAVLQLFREGEPGAFIGQNSWGESFGRGGRFAVAVSVVRGWFAARGEFAQPQQRKLPAREWRTAVAEPDEPTQDDAGRTQQAEQSDSGTTTEHITAADVLEGDRVLDPPEELGQESVTVLGEPQLLNGRRARVRTTAGTFTVAAAAPLTVRRPRQ